MAKDLKCPKCDSDDIDIQSNEKGTWNQCRQFSCLHGWQLNKEGRQEPTGASSGETVAAEIELKAREYVESGMADREKPLERKAMKNMVKDVTKRGSYTCDLCGETGFKTGQGVGQHKRFNCPKKGGKPQPRATRTGERKAKREAAAIIDDLKEDHEKDEPISQMIQSLEETKKVILDRIIEDHPELKKLDAAIAALKGNPT